MSWINLSGSAVTALDNTTGKVFSLSSIQAGGQLSLHLQLPPVAHCKQLWGGQTESSDVDTDQVRQQIPDPRCPVPWQTSAGQRAGFRRGLRLTAVGRSGGFRVSKALCLLQPTGSPSPMLWTMTQAELCVSSLLQHSSSCLSQLKSWGSISAPICISEMRKAAAGAAGVAPTWVGGGRLRLLLTKRL